MTESRDPVALRRLVVGDYSDLAHLRPDPSALLYSLQPMEGGHLPPRGFRLRTGVTFKTDSCIFIPSSAIAIKDVAKPTLAEITSMVNARVQV